MSLTLGKKVEFKYNVQQKEQYLTDAIFFLTILLLTNFILS